MKTGKWEIPMTTHPELPLIQTTNIILLLNIHSLPPLTLLHTL